MKFANFFLIFIMGSVFSNLFSVNVVFHNKTDKNVYVVTCYYHKLRAVGLSEPERILPKSDLLIRLPEKKSGGYTRYALFSLDEKKLKGKEKLTRDEFKLLQSIQIGTGKGPDFFIGLDSLGGLKVSDKSQTTPEPEEAIFKIKEEALGRYKKMYIDPKKYPHANEVAKVRVATTISAKEREIVQKRLRKVSTKIKNVLHEEVGPDTVPRVSICLSGGGFRAMLASLGFLMGAQKIGFLDYACYISALSGSTWAVGPWITSDLSIDRYFEQLLPRIKTSIFTQKDLNVKNSIESLLKKFIFDQPIGLIDLFGTYLANELLKGFSAHKNPNNISLDEQLVQIATGDIPFPIYTAILTKQDPDYNWFEFTPCECGSDYLGGYVPTWALGRQFKNGQSIKQEPPQSLGFVLGACGSAISVNAVEAWPHIKEKINFSPLTRLMDKIETLDFGRVRVLPAKIWNYTVGMADLARGQQSTLTLVDAGINFNIPLPPLFRRKADLIVILDAAEYRKGAPELKKAYERAKADGIKLPKVNFDEIKETVFNIFVDEKDPRVPVIIYIPFVKNDKFSPNFDPDVELKKGKIDSFTFAYDAELARKVAGLARFSLESHESDIYRTLKLVIERKKRSAITIGGARSSKSNFKKAG